MALVLQPFPTGVVEILRVVVQRLHDFHETCSRCGSFCLAFHRVGACDQLCDDHVQYCVGGRFVRSALVGVNAAVVGLLLAALYQPVWTNAIKAPADFGLGLAAFALLVFWKTPPWLVVVLSALGGWGLERLMQST